MTATNALPTPVTSRLALAVGLVSGAAIAFEIALTRVFSLLFQYHFAFLAVSLAILGLSFGTALIKLLHIDDARALPALRRTLALLSLSYVAGAFLLATIPTTVAITLHVIVALVPFVLTGMALALIFTLRPTASGALYSADLIGAAIGVAGVLGLLALLGAFNVVIVLGAVTAIAALALDFRPSVNAQLRIVADASAHPRIPRIQLAPILCLVLALVVLVANLGARFIDYAPLRIGDAPPDKTMLAVLRDPSLGARVVYSAWDPFARIDVVETNDDSLKYVFTDAGAGSFMLKQGGDPAELSNLRASVEYVPFATGSVSKTLILGAGAGKDVILAQLAGSDSIVAVEVNPTMVDVTRRFGDFNGRVFDQPHVRVHVGDARTFTESSTELFDLIYLNVVYSQAAPPASQALVENYIFTREAMRAYLRRLNDGGRLAIIAHNGLEGTRAAITAIAALNDLGVPLPQTLDHLALLMQNNSDATVRPTVMIVSKQPLTPQAIELYGSASSALNLQLLHLPGAFELGFKPLKDGQSLDAFLNIDKTFALFPTTDNSPFFYKLDPGIPAPITQALVFAAVLAAFLLVLLIGQKQDTSPALIAYIAAIGLGFMLIEVPLIQRFQLLVGYPVLSLVLVLGTLLLAGGAGSRISQRWPVAALGRRVTIAAVGIVAIGLVYLVALPTIVAASVGLPFVARAAMVVLLTAPLGFAMGVPFPSALRIAGEGGSRNIALLWGVNGAFSVLGSSLAMWLAMAAGFQYALGLGVAAYALLIVVARRVTP